MGFESQLNDKISADFPVLQTLSIAKIGGEISSLLSKAAPTVTNLNLSMVDMNTEIKKAFTNLKCATIDEEKIDIDECPQVLKATGTLGDIFKILE